MAHSPETENELARLEKLAVWLDSKYETPIGVRVGWDGILGLVPVAGDFVTTIISGYIILRSAVLGASMSVLLRMGLNVLIDDFIGVVPLVGWIGDFLWRSNLKNVSLLRAHLGDPRGTQRRSNLVLGGAIGLAISIVVVIAFLFAWAVWLVWAMIYKVFVPT